MLCCNHNHNHNEKENTTNDQQKQPKGHKHGLWMMLLCCIPMLLLFIYPLINQSEGLQNSPYAFLFILICPFMHIVMLFGMRDKHKSND